MFTKFILPILFILMLLMSCVSNEGDDLEIHEKIGSRRIDFNVPVKNTSDIVLY